MQIASTDLRGRVTTTLVVTNRLDRGLAERNVIPPEEIRSLRI